MSFISFFITSCVIFVISRGARAEGYAQGYQQGKLDGAIELCAILPDRKDLVGELNAYRDRFGPIEMTPEGVRDPAPLT